MPTQLNYLLARDRNLDMRLHWDLEEMFEVTSGVFGVVVSKLFLNYRESEPSLCRKICSMRLGSAVLLQIIQIIWPSFWSSATIIKCVIKKESNFGQCWQGWRRRAENQCAKENAMPSRVQRSCHYRMFRVESSRTSKSWKENPLMNCHKYGFGRYCILSSQVAWAWILWKPMHASAQPQRSRIWSKGEGNTWCWETLSEKY